MYIITIVIPENDKVIAQKFYDHDKLERTIAKQFMIKNYDNKVKFAYQDLAMSLIGDENLINEDDWDYLVDYIQERYNIEFATCDDVYEWFENNFMKVTRFSKSVYKPLAEQTSNNSNPIIKIRTAIIIDD